MLLHDSINGGQPQPGSFAGFLRGEEGLKNPRHDFRRDAASGVAEAEANEATDARLRVPLDERFIHNPGRGADHEGSAPRHGVPRVDGKVQKHLFDHAHIPKNGGQIRRGNELQGHVRAEQTFQHLAHAIDHFIQFHFLRLDFLFPAERQQLAGQMRGSFGGGGDLLERLLGIATFHHAAQDHVRVPLNHSKDIVKVMGHASGQLADGFHLLGLSQLLLQSFAIGNLADKPGEHRRTLGRHSRDAQFHGKLRAVGAHRAHFYPPTENGALTGGKIPRQTVPIPLAQSGWDDEFGQFPADHFGAPATKGFLPGRIPLENPAFVINRDHAIQR